MAQSLKRLDAVAWDVLCALQQQPVAGEAGMSAQKISLFVRSSPLTFQPVECVPFFPDTSHREEQLWNDR
jgi:hypothetical protein